jgi:hypothetical protein
MTAEQLAQIAAAEMTDSSLLGTLPQAWNMSNGVESALVDSGYTPSSLLNAVKNANGANGTGLQQNLMNYGKQKIADAQSGALTNRVLSNVKDDPSKAMKLMNSMGGQPQQQPMAPPPPRQQQQPVEPLPLAYTNSLGLPSLQESEAEKRKRRQMGLLR